MNLMARGMRPTASCGFLDAIECCDLGPCCIDFAIRPAILPIEVVPSTLLNWMLAASIFGSDQLGL